MQPIICMNEMHTCTFELHKIVQQQNSGAVEDFYFTVFRSLSMNPKVKELLKSVRICQSYRKNKSGTFFMDHGVIMLCNNCMKVVLYTNKKAMLSL